MTRRPQLALRPIDPRLAFALGCLLVAAAYWVGLRGPLLLDDPPNLAKVFEWLDGHRSWQSTLFDNTSGYGGRPLSMASFLFDAAVWHRDIWHFKLTNVLLHLACGTALLFLYRALLYCDPRLARHASWLAVLLALGWLALPIHASSVLYVVQRMAILSALFTILTLYVYVRARVAIDRGSRVGVAVMWLGVPLLTMLAFTSKENGLLAPLLALAVELSFLRPVAGQRRPRPVVWFLAVTVAVPMIAACVLLLAEPDRWLGAYALRDFTLLERVLTQPRVLWDYVAASLLPQGPRLGIFHDNFAKSSSLWSPWTTLPAMAAWLAVLAGAIRFRRRYPTIFGGVLVFLCGHAMESTILPLELYFEHRNYLPSIGMMLALAGVWGAIAERMPSPTRLYRFARTAAVAVTLLVFLGATHGRARVWSTPETLYAQEARFNPGSPRVHSNLAAVAMASGNLEAALGHVAAAEGASTTGGDMTHSLWRLLAYCETRRPPPRDLYSELEARAHGAISSYAMQAWDLLVERAGHGRCPGLDVDELIDLAQPWVNHNPVPSQFQENWRPRLDLARLMAFRGDLAAAAVQGDIAWRDSGANVGVGMFLFQVNASLGRVDACHGILAQLQRAARQGDYRLARTLASFSQALADGSIEAAAPAATSAE